MTTPCLPSATAYSIYSQLPSILEAVPYTRKLRTRHNVVTGTHLSRYRVGTRGGTCESGNEHSGSIKCGEFLDWLGTGLLLKKDSSPWSEEVSKTK